MEEVTVQEFRSEISNRENIRVILESDFLSTRPHKVVNLYFQLGKIIINDWEIDIKKCKIFLEKKKTFLIKDWEINAKKCKIFLERKEYVITSTDSKTKLILYSGLRF